MNRSLPRHASDSCTSADQPGPSGPRPKGIPMNAETTRTATTKAAGVEPEVRPRLLRLGNEAERAELEHLLADASVTVHDSLQRQLRELVQTRRPDRTLSPKEAVEGVARLLLGSPAAEAGTWAYYPWSRRLVHVLNREEFIELRTSRNRYLITAAEQAKLAEKRVGIVGLSVGQSVALALALERTGGELRLADHDTLDTLEPQPPPRRPA